MKTKLIATAVVFIAVILFGGFKNIPPKKNVQPPATLNQTLNGYDGPNAKKMIANFALDFKKDRNDKSVSVWYNLDQITTIYNLIIKEETQATNPMDGVRIYFGSNRLVGSATQISPIIFLVSTTKKTPTPAHPSTHGDYYDHDASLLPGSNIGTLTAGQAAFGYGAVLYSSTYPGPDNCQNPSQHYMDSQQAHEWVRARVQGSGFYDPSAYNTEGEWFDLCFIKNLLHAIIADKTERLDGLRIYYANGYIDEYGDVRDVFLLVPTHSINANLKYHEDYYQCLENLQNTPFCPSRYEPKFRLTGKSLLFKKMVKYQQLLRGKNRRLFAAYDNGELCPNSCN